MFNRSKKFISKCGIIGLLIAGSLSAGFAANKPTGTTAPVTTVSPAAGTYATPQTVTLKANQPATIYYTTNGTVPTTASTKYVGPITISTSMALRYFAKNTAGISEAVKSAVYTISAPPATAPVTTVSPAAGTYATPQTVTLTANQPASIYYTIDGTVPTTASTKYAGPIAISTSTTLHYFAQNTAGISEAVKSAVYTISAPPATAPVTTVWPIAGTYATPQTVTLSANQPATIYYTIDGTVPTTASTKYAGPITISATTTLRYFAQDTAGISEAVKSAAYVISSSGSEVLVGVGNIGNCYINPTGTFATGLLLDSVMLANPSATVFTAGDNQYTSGTAAEFASCYDKSDWGKYKNITRAAMGDHDHISNYSWTYFGPQAGTQAQSYYSYDLGNYWHIVVLDTMVPITVGSAQYNWLAADLTASTGRYVMAIFHHPLFNANGGFSLAKPAWDLLYQHGTEIVFNGHVHAYQRFVPQAPDGVADPAFGIREFVVGTGGTALVSLNAALPNTAVQHAGTWGIMKFVLGNGTYSWEFIPVAGQTFTDSGTATCHGGPPTKIL